MLRLLVESSNLAPGLLLAMPQLADRHFSRAVVLMIEHGDSGSFGLVINHQSDPSERVARQLGDELGRRGQRRRMGRWSREPEHGVGSARADHNRAARTRHDLDHLDYLAVHIA